MKPRRLLFRILLFALVLLAALPFAVPFAWLISTAFKPNADIFTFSLALVPDPATLDHFHRVLGEFHFEHYALNSLLVTVGVVAGSLVSSSLVAYALVFLEWPDRKLLFTLLMGTLLLPAQVTMIPVFLLFRALGWIDTFLPLIVPAWLATPFYVFLLRQFFLGVPRALIESARLDGAGELRIPVAIVLPLCRPVLLTVALFSGIGAWNDFFGPLIYLYSEERKTLALALQSLTGQYASEWGMLMAAALLMALPVIALFVVAQKHFIQGAALTGLKG